MKKKYYARCYATINKNTNAYRECMDMTECEKFYLELGYPFYANDEIKHTIGSDRIHVFQLTIDNQKTMLDYVRAMAKNAGADLTDITDEKLILRCLSFTGANIESALESGLAEDK